MSWGRLYLRQDGDPIERKRLQSPFKDKNLFMGDGQVKRAYRSLLYGMMRAIGPVVVIQQERDELVYYWPVPSTSEDALIQFGNAKLRGYLDPGDFENVLWQEAPVTHTVLAVRKGAESSRNPVLLSGGHYVDRSLASMTWMTIALKTQVIDKLKIPESFPITLLQDASPLDSEFEGTRRQVTLDFFTLKPL